MQRLGVQHELPALGRGDRGGDRDLAAELVGCPGLAFADALHLRGMQGVDLRPALALVLMADPLARSSRGRKRPRARHRRRSCGDVPDQAAEPGAQELERSPGALELMGMGIAPDHDGGALGHPQIALAQLHTFALGQRHQLLDRPVHQPGIGRMGDRLGLNGGVHHHPLQVLGLDRPGLVGHRQALLQQGRNLLLAQPLAPAGQRRTIEGQLVAEHQFAAEVLEVRVLHPAVAQRLIGQVVHVLEDEQPGHQPRRQRWLPWPDRRPSRNDPARNSQSISAARRTSGWRMLMIYPERAGTDPSDDRPAVTHGFPPTADLPSKKSRTA